MKFKRFCWITEWDSSINFRLSQFKKFEPQKHTNNKIHTHRNSKYYNVKKKTFEWMNVPPSVLLNSLPDFDKEV